MFKKFLCGYWYNPNSQLSVSSSQNIAQLQRGGLWMDIGGADPRDNSKKLFMIENWLKENLRMML